MFRQYIATLPKDEISDDEGRIKEKDEPKTAEELALERRKDEVRECATFVESLNLSFLGRS